MTRFFASIRGRLVVSHVAAVLVSVLVMVVIAEPLTHRFFNSHVENMGVGGGMMGAGTGSMMGQLQASLNDSFRSAIAVALVVSVVTAIAASFFAAKRLADPIEQISKAARNLAGGDYHRPRHRAGRDRTRCLGTRRQHVGRVSREHRAAEDRAHQ